ncbi:hypothetical protein [Massilia sp. METH4]|uniref:hypothetical protein n=1 Tax=Massilia sp. METH4 TaxID=3123041 RepID=UPI0030CE0572
MMADLRIALRMPEGRLKKATLLAVLVLTGYWLLFGWMVYRSPLAYAAMDLNRDGEVSFGEADYISSFGVNTFTDRGRQCTEYFALKDGLRLKTACRQR